METEAAAEAPKRGRVRWIVCGLLFFATTVNYVDRQALGILKPVIQQDLHWTEADYAWIVFAFQFAYAIAMPAAGRLIDWLGTRAGYALAVVVWSAASMSHAAAGSVWQFASARFGLGVGEAANFPAALKAVANWFPEKERALATGIFNSGSNIGAIAAPLLVEVVAVRFGWRSTFLATGSLDLIWLAAWLLYFRRPEEHPSISKAELSYILAGRPKEPSLRIPYSKLLGHRGAWAFMTGKFLTDPVWWFFLFWIPGFLHDAYGLNLTQLGPPLVAIYLAADAGSIFGGYLSSGLIARGWNLNRARKTAMLVCACAAVPIVSLIAVRGLWPAVGLIALAAAAHQGWSANLYTMVADSFPRAAVASVVGMGGLAGAISGMLISPVVGYWLDFSHGAYRPLFMAAGAAYLIALAAIHSLQRSSQRSPARIGS